MPTHEILSVSLKSKVTDDRYSRSFTCARALVEQRMRGHRVNLDHLAAQLAPLPESARRSLLGGVDRETRDRVTATLATNARARRRV